MDPSAPTRSVADGRIRSNLCAGGPPSVGEGSVQGPPPTPARGQREPRSSRPLDLPSGSEDPNDGPSPFGGWSGTDRDPPQCPVPLCTSQPVPTLQDRSKTQVGTLLSPSPRWGMWRRSVRRVDDPDARHSPRHHCRAARHHLPLLKFRKANRDPSRRRRQPRRAPSTAPRIVRW